MNRIQKKKRITIAIMTSLLMTIVTPSQARDYRIETQILQKSDAVKEWVIKPPMEKEKVKGIKEKSKLNALSLDEKFDLERWSLLQASKAVVLWRCEGYLFDQKVKPIEKDLFKKSFELNHDIDLAQEYLRTEAMIHFKALAHQYQGKTCNQMGGLKMAIEEDEAVQQK